MSAPGAGPRGPRRLRLPLRPWLRSAENCPSLPSPGLFITWHWEAEGGSAARWFGRCPGRAASARDDCARWLGCARRVRPRPCRDRAAAARDLFPARAVVARGRTGLSPGSRYPAFACLTFYPGFCRPQLSIPDFAGLINLSRLPRQFN